MINNALSVGAVHKLRFAQDVILYNLELDEEIEGFDGQAHLAAWQDDPIWQKTRENVERLTGDPRLGGGLLRHRGRVRAARRRAVPQRLRDADRRAAGRLRDADAVRLGRVRRRARAARRAAPVRDARRRRARTAPRTRQTMQGWLAEWTPVSIEAARTLQPIWSQPAEKAMRFEESMERSSQRFADAAVRHRPRDPQGGVSMSRRDRFKSDRTSSNRAGVTLMNNQVGHMVADVMRQHDNVKVEELPSMIRVDGDGPVRLRLRGDRRGARLGRLRQRRLRGDHVDPLRAHGRRSTTA